GSPGLISAAQVENLRAILRPGDILIERRNWFLSNAFLPGFWPHSALYTGGAEGLRELGIDGDARVAKHIEELEAPDSHGEQLVVIEAMSEGVVFTSLEHSIGEADAVCVLRPNLPRDEIAEAVAKALSHHGKPYDFDFDFFSNDRLVCTEVVYQAYEDLIDFELVEIMGRRTLPAVEIVRKWEQERGRPDAELKLIAFYDMDEEYGVARAAGPETLRETLHRTSVAFLQTQEGAPAFLGPGFYLLIAVFLAGLLVMRPRR
ncbi:MAG: YiiX/YebB-like N1pC/P60 family cysteine hydrolase, partial [Planctomycetota bacterium]|nr:YiiX/YebB-like N1pC/P60 family cysteine hydrolase [Planctomycetota bacterium]